MVKNRMAARGQTRGHPKAGIALGYHGQGDTIQQNHARQYSIGSRASVSEQIACNSSDQIAETVSSSAASTSSPCSAGMPQVDGALIVKKLLTSSVKLLI
jgi:hypothetical protein